MGSSHITPGSVSVMGLMNDKENQVRLLVDEDVLKEEYFGCHPCINTSSKVNCPCRKDNNSIKTRFVFMPQTNYTSNKLTCNL